MYFSQMHMQHGSLKRKLAVGGTEREGHTRLIGLKLHSLACWLLLTTQ
jgi:hypothetical protein